MKMFSFPNHLFLGRELLFRHGCLWLAFAWGYIYWAQLTRNGDHRGLLEEERKLRNSCLANNKPFLRAPIQSSLFGFIALFPCPQSGFLCYAKADLAVQNSPLASQLISQPVSKSVGQPLNQSVSQLFRKLVSQSASLSALYIHSLLPSFTLWLTHSTASFNNWTTHSLIS